MLIGLVADPHFANHPQFGKPTHIPGCNHRLLQCHNAMVWAAEALQGAGVEHVVVLGDLTEHHGVIDATSWEMARAALLAFGDLPVTVFPGNHDMEQSGRSVIPTFREVAGAVTEPQMLVEGVAMVPYAEAEETLRAAHELAEEGASVLLCHHHFDGARHGPHEFRPPAGIGRSLLPEGVRVISGHYHLRHEVSDKVMYCGSLLHKDFGEVNYTPGVTVLDTDDGSTEFIETPPAVAPRFHVLEDWRVPLEEVPGNPEADYYRIDFPENVDPSEMAHLRDDLPRVKVKPIRMEGEVRSRVQEILAEETSVEEDAGRKVEVGDVIDAYALMHSDDEARARRLAEMGHDIARAAMAPAAQGGGA